MKKNILIIMPSMFIGGAERSLLGLLEAFNYDEYNINLFLYRHEGEFLNQIPKQVRLLNEINEYKTFDVPIKSLINFKSFRFAIARILSKLALKMHCFFTKEKKGIWMSMQYTAKFLVPLLPKIPGKYDMGIMFLGIPNILTDKVECDIKLAWNHTDYSELFPNKKMDRNIYNKVDYIVSVSEDCCSKFVNQYPMLSKKAIVIENILAANLIRKQSDEAIEQDQMNDKYINLLSIGRFSDAKNFDNVPEICKKIISKGLSVKWYLIGYGRDEQLIKDKISEFNMQDNVIILGKKENPYPYIKACDAYVQPSRYEGKSVAVREAQILEKPVIITNYATAHSQLKDGYDGIIVPMDNEGCADGICKVLTDKKLMEQLSYNCSKNDYTNSKEVEKIYNLI